MKIAYKLLPEAVQTQIAGYTSAPSRAKFVHVVRRGASSDARVLFAMAVLQDRAGALRVYVEEFPAEGDFGTRPPFGTPTTMADMLAKSRKDRARDEETRKLLDTLRDPERMRSMERVAEALDRAKAAALHSALRAVFGAAKDEKPFPGDAQLVARVRRKLKERSMGTTLSTSDIEAAVAAELAKRK